MTWTLALFLFAQLNAFCPVSLTQQGLASWYSKEDPGVGLYTASGETFDDTQLTCASWYFPLGTYVKVTNTQNGKFIICRVNDRGPRQDLNRAIDLTKFGFEQIADPQNGLIPVTIARLGS